MMIFVPDYYRHFSCRKGDCRHSCCIGWEIDIDPDALAKYQAVPGEMGNRLKDSIVLEDACTFFRLNAEERCPFLNPEGLCDLILTLGEDSLCQICADHPRFRNHYTDRVEMGLGMCCEAAAELILSQPGKACWTLLKNTGPAMETDPADAEFFTWRDELLQIAQCRALPLEERAQMLAEAAGNTALLPRYRDFIPLLLSLERMDDAWGILLERLQDAPDGPLPPSLILPLEQLLVYFLNRHLPPALEDGQYEERLFLCLLLWQMLKGMCCTLPGADFAALAEWARLCSAEIEYSDENIEQLLNAVADHI